MNPNPSIHVSLSAADSGSGSDEANLLNRREAIKRVALMVGLTLTPRLIEGVAHAQAAGASSAQPGNLNATQFATVDAIAERILPRTDTPGARDVGVPQFLDVMFGGYLTAADKKTWTDGLADLEARAQRTHRQSFNKLNETQQDALLKTIATESQAKEKTFFHQIRDLVLIGYFTSETVGRTVTQYDPVPGRYDACVPLSEVGNRSWTR